tara:strand:+ start:2930 stop:3055 length:126 start_codon:yes stop_codon:yes gene_type:complete
MKRVLLNARKKNVVKNIKSEKNLVKVVLNFKLFNYIDLNAG